MKEIIFSAATVAGTAIVVIRNGPHTADWAALVLIVLVGIAISARQDGKYPRQ